MSSPVSAVPPTPEVLLSIRIEHELYAMLAKADTYALITRAEIGQVTRREMVTEAHRRIWQFMDDYIKEQHGQ